MKRFLPIHAGIRDGLHRVLEQIDAVMEEDPWIHLPRDYKLNELATVIPLLTELALVRTADNALCRRMLHAAARHGEKRLQQGFPDSLIFQEYPMVRQSLWSYIRRNHGRGGDPSAFEAMVRIDSALALATKASLRGYYRPTFEVQGRWPAAIDDLSEEWQRLPSLD